MGALLVNSVHLDRGLEEMQFILMAALCGLKCHCKKKYITI